MQNRIVRSRALGAAAVLVTIATGANAAIVNGDFEAGDTGFTSSYGTNDITLPAQYLVVQNDTVHPAWTDFADHTFGDGSGRFMVVNGTDSGAGPAWAQVVAVTPNTQYTLSAWFASVFPDAPANAEFRVDGVLVAPAFVAPLPPGVWAQNSVTFNSGAAASLSLEIWDTNQVFSGNDYAIDDITLVPAPGAAALLGLGTLVGLRRRR